MRSSWKKSLVAVGLMSAAATLTGCSVALQDAAAAGVFDYISGSIAEILATITTQPIIDLLTAGAE